MTHKLNQQQSTPALIQQWTHGFNKNNLDQLSSSPLSQHQQINYNSLGRSNVVQQSTSSLSQQNQQVNYTSLNRRNVQQQSTPALNQNWTQSLNRKEPYQQWTNGLYR